MMSFLKVFQQVNKIYYNKKFLFIYHNIKLIKCEIISCKNKICWTLSRNW